MSQNNALRLPGIDDGMPEPACKPLPYIRHQKNGTLIHQRRGDGYIDATAMCRAYGKLFANWQQLKSTGELFAAAETIIGIPIMVLVQSQVGGHRSRTGTWIHPLLAIALATWCSPSFFLIVCGWVHDWLQGRQPDITAARHLEPFVIGRLIEGIQGAPEEIEYTTQQPTRSNPDVIIERIEALDKKIDRLHQHARIEARADLDFIRSEVVGGQADLLEKLDQNNRINLATYDAAERAHKSAQSVETALSRKSELAGSMMRTPRQGPTASGLPRLVEPRSSPPRDNPVH